MDGAQLPAPGKTRCSPVSVSRVDSEQVAAAFRLGDEAVRSKLDLLSATLYAHAGGGTRRWRAKPVADLVIALGQRLDAI